MSESRMLIFLHNHVCEFDFRFSEIPIENPPMSTLEEELENYFDNENENENGNENLSENEDENEGEMVVERPTVVAKNVFEQTKNNYADSSISLSPGKKLFANSCLDLQ